MMVGRQEGRFLELLVFATQATRVLEIGTFTGYSAIAMAAGLPKDGAIISLEVDPHHAQVARGQHRRRRAREPHQRHRRTRAALARGAPGPLRPRLHRRRQGLLRRLLRSRTAQAGGPRPHRRGQHAPSRRRAGVREAAARRCPGTARLQRQDRERPEGGVRAHDDPRRRHADPAGRVVAEPKRNGRRARLPPPPLAALGARDATASGAAG